MNQSNGAKKATSRKGNHEQRGGSIMQENPANRFKINYINFLITEDQKGIEIWL
jgi:hypothetical protein